MSFLKYFDSLCSTWVYFYPLRCVYPNEQQDTRSLDELPDMVYGKICQNFPNWTFHAVPKKLLGRSISTISEI